jgi:hypothetical protein
VASSSAARATTFRPGRCAGDGVDDGTGRHGAADAGQRAPPLVGSHRPGDDATSANVWDALPTPKNERALHSSRRGGMERNSGTQVQDSDSDSNNTLDRTRRDTHVGPHARRGGAGADKCAALAGAGQERGEPMRD